VSKSWLEPAFQLKKKPGGSSFEKRLKAFLGWRKGSRPYFFPISLHGPHTSTHSRFSKTHRLLQSTIHHLLSLVSSATKTENLKLMLLIFFFKF
jgi:hypothetical protein